MGRPPRQVNWTELGESAAGSPHSFMFGGRSGLRADRVCEGGVRGRGGAGGALWRPGRRHCPATEQCSVCVVQCGGGDSDGGAAQEWWQECQSETFLS